MGDTSADGAPGLWPELGRLSDAIAQPGDEAFEERPCTEADFAATVARTERDLGRLPVLLGRLQPFSVDGLTPEDRGALARLLLALCEHRSPSAWSSGTTLGASREALTALCLKAGCSLKELTCNTSLLKQLWPLLCAKLERDCWKRHPAAVRCFASILLQIESPVLAEHLQRVFPATLLILDDWEDENKLLGCQLMSHIIDNVTRAELLRQRYDDVIFDKLQRLIYERKSDLVLQVVKCVATLTVKVDHRYTQSYELGRYDKILKVLLGHMEMEQVLKMRLAFAESLQILLSAGSTCLMLWSQRILRVLSEYLAIEDLSDGLTQLHSLNAMLIFLQKTWPRAAAYADQVLSSLLRLLLGLTQDTEMIKASECNKEKIIVVISQCLHILGSAAPERCRELLNGLEDVPAPPEFLQVVKSNIQLNESSVT